MPLGVLAVLFGTAAAYRRGVDNAEAGRRWGLGRSHSSLVGVAGMPPCWIVVGVGRRKNKEKRRDCGAKKGEPISILRLLC